MTDRDETALTGGNVASSVVRIGTTVRKPGGPQTPLVHAVLVHLAAAGVRWAPRSYGVDEHGRHVLEYVEGEPAAVPSRFSDEGMARVGRMIRDLHDALDGFEAPHDSAPATAIEPDGADLICHHDLAPWNLVSAADRWVFVDWDACGPGTRQWDLACAAQAFVPLIANQDASRQAARLRVLIGAYGADQDLRRLLLGVLSARTWAMYDLLLAGHRTGTRPWADIYPRDGEYWLDSARHVEAHADVWRLALLG